MSLKAFHIVFVTISTLLAFVFGGWCLHFHRATGGTTYLVLTICALLFGVLLIVYGFWFWRKIRTPEEERRRRRKHIHGVVVLFGVWLFASRAASACSVCYGEAEGPMIDAARIGVWLLFGMIGAIQLGLVLFFVYLWRRARRFRMQDLAVSAVRKESFQP